MRVTSAVFRPDAYLPDVKAPQAPALVTGCHLHGKKNEYATARCGPDANFAFLALELKQEEEYA
jgi:hypothetical protein